MFTIFGHEASLKEMCWLFIILVQATLLATAQFWDEFLLEESYSCRTHPNLHCFSTTFLSLSGQPMNCSNINTSDTGILVTLCYKYVFNTGHAAASAIGILSATGLIIYIVCLVFLKVSDGIRSHKWLIICLKLAVVEMVIFCQVLFFLKTNHSTTASADSAEYYAIGRSFCKTLSMSFMIVSSILSFPLNKFMKSEYEELPDI